MISNKNNLSFKSSADNGGDFVRIEASERSKLIGDVRLHGQFKASYEKNGITVKGEKVLNHIVLIVTRSLNYQALTPFKEVVVFDDDVHEDGDSCTGSFVINIEDHLQFDGEGDYYIMCSLGTCLSNIIKFSILNNS